MKKKKSIYIYIYIYIYTYIYIQISWPRDRPRPLLLENCNQRFLPLAKRVAPVSLYQNIYPTKCLRNQLGIVRSVTIGRCNWCSLTSAGPPLTNILDRRRQEMFIALASFRSFYAKTISGHLLDLLKENGLHSIWWEFRLNGFLEYKILNNVVS